MPKCTNLTKRGKLCDSNVPEGCVKCPSCCQYLSLGKAIEAQCSQTENINVGVRSERICGQKTRKGGMCMTLLRKGATACGSCHKPVPEIGLPPDVLSTVSSPTTTTTPTATTTTTNTSSTTTTTRTTTTTTEITLQSGQCPKCDGIVYPDDKFCHECGQNLRTLIPKEFHSETSADNVTSSDFSDLISSIKEGNVIKDISKLEKILQGMNIDTSSATKEYTPSSPTDAKTPDQSASTDFPIRYPNDGKGPQSTTPGSDDKKENNTTQPEEMKTDKGQQESKDAHSDGSNSNPEKINLNEAKEQMNNSTNDKEKQKQQRLMEGLNSEKQKPPNSLENKERDENGNAASEFEKDKVDDDNEISEDSDADSSDSDDGVHPPGEIHNGPPGASQSGNVSRRKKKNKRRRTRNQNKNQQEGANFKVYQKSKTDNSSYYPGTSASHACEAPIPVEFNVVISKKFHYNPEYHKVGILFNDDRLGGFGDPCPKFYLRPERNLGEGFYYLKGLLDIPKNQLSKIAYKYVLETSVGNLIFEHVYSSKWTKREESVRHNRRLALSNLTDIGDYWAQYDGVMHKQPDENVFERLAKSVKDFFKDLAASVLHETKLSARAFFPQWEGFHLQEGAISDTAENVLKDISQIWVCMKKSFYNESLKPMESEMAEILKEYITPRLNSFLQFNKSGEAICLTAALTIVHMVIQYNIQLNHQEKTKLYHGLLIQPDSSTGQCYDFEALPFHFPTSTLLKQIRTSLVIFLTNSNTNAHCDPSWMETIPLLHFLNQDSSPYKEVNMGYNETEDKWWGIQEFSYVVKTFKRYMKTSKVVLDPVLSRLRPLLGVDKLLARTIGIVIPLKSLQSVIKENYLSPSIIMKRLHDTTKKAFFYANGTNPKIREVVECVKTLCNVTGDQINMEEKEKRLFTTSQLTDIGERMTTANVLFYQLQYNIRTIDDWELFVHSLDVVVEMIRYCVVVMKQNSQNDPDANEEKTAKLKQLDGAMQKEFETLKKYASSWLEQYLLKRILAIEILPDRSYHYVLGYLEEPQMWTFLLQIDFEDEIWNSKWNEFVKSQFRKRIEQLTPFYRMELYCKDHINFEIFPLLNDLCSAAAIDAFEEELKVGKSYMLEGGNDPSARKYGEMFSLIFVKRWPKLHNGEPDMNSAIILYHVLSNPSFARYLKVFCGQTEFYKHLTEKCQQLIATALGLFDEAGKKFIEGSIEVKHIKMFLEHHQNFLEIMKTKHDQELRNMSPEERKKMPDFPLMTDIAIKLREQELKEFSAMKEKVGVFLGLCHQIGNVDTKHLDDQMREDVNCCILRHICNMRPPVQESKEQPVEIIYFDVPPEVIEVLELMEKIQKSSLFGREWRKHGAKANEENRNKLTLLEVIEDVWTPAITAWNQICEGLCTLQIEFKDVDEILKYIDNDKSLEKELQLMEKHLGRRAWAKECMDRIEQYRNLERHRKGAKLMKQLQLMFELKGDFSDVDVLLSVGGNKSKPLKSIQKSVLTAGKNMLKLDLEKVECIEVLSEKKPLVKWLKENVKEPRELKVLVDLAMISATGMGDLDIKKVQCFGDAVAGYSSLIYDLEAGSDIGFQKFWNLCQPVWKAYRNDKQLVQKMRDTNLEWIKRIKESHGSMEVSALKKVEDINARGIFKVGSLDKDREHKTVQNVNDVISLTVPVESIEENETEQQEIKYSYPDLSDIQSKLMLVAGRASNASNDVEKFMEIFDAITRLAHTYVKIWKAGSILFKDFEVIFCCDPKKRPNCWVTFGLSQKKLVEKIREGETILEQIEGLCRFMDDCLRDWMKFVNDKRDDFHNLNHFTTEQLVILRTELAKLSPNREKLSDIVYPMLSLVKKKCTELDIREAFREASQEIKANENQKEADQKEAEKMENLDDSLEDGDEAEKQEEEVVDKEKLRHFIEELKDSGVDEEMALKAWRAEIFDIDDAIVWCMDNEAEEESKEEHLDQTAEPESSDEEDADEITIQKGESTTSATDKLLESLYGTAKPVKEQLEEMWKNYLEMQESSMSDVLSVEHLGLILDYLGNRDKDDFERQFPIGLERGRPNLLVVPQAEMWSQTLSIYMGNDIEGPLPSAAEVLVCSDKTTTEEVELLWHRAFRSIPGRIFCLVAADNLSYEVSDIVERSLNEHVKKHSSPGAYKLVILCSRENESRSRLATALDRYKVQDRFHHDSEKIKEYLQKQFAASNVQQSAARADIQGVAVRAIRSNRAGLGKSLKVQRYLEQLQNTKYVKIPLHRKKVDSQFVCDKLMEHVAPPGREPQMLIHIDIAHEVESGVDHLLFNLLVLGSLTNPEGHVWQRSERDLYLIETLPLLQIDQKAQEVNQNEEDNFVHRILPLLPAIICKSPQETYNALRANETNATDLNQWMDLQIFLGGEVQRVYRYLKRFREGGDLTIVKYEDDTGNQHECLEYLLKYCGLKNPTWSELMHFVSFLNVQLHDAEENNFCGEACADLFPGFFTCVIRMMIHMSKDFATRSLNISETTPGLQQQEEDGDEGALIEYEIRRRWEKSPHPYLFFNYDKHSMTFLGFEVDMVNGDLIDPTTGDVLERAVIAKELQIQLVQNGAQLHERFDKLDRWKKLEKLANVLGVRNIRDPDNTYELTTDNVMKMLAIHMRFRCEIPVIIMGETGCGKTRLIQFMCDFQKPPGLEHVKNMILMKVHGGTTEREIRKSLTLAMAQAEKNRKEPFCDHLDTVLFFDEANTTEAIGLIKEIMCDGTIEGKPLRQTGLKIIAACNPYRKHTPKMIQHLEKAGLGYHVRATQTQDKLGRIPMRQLVYRVQALPQSMLPLVWDFGQLSQAVEKKYIKQIVKRFIRNEMREPQARAEESDDEDEEINPMETPPTERLMDTIRQEMTVIDRKRATPKVGVQPVPVPMPIPQPTIRTPNRRAYMVNPLQQTVPPMNLARHAPPRRGLQGFFQEMRVEQQPFGSNEDDVAVVDIRARRLQQQLETQFQPQSNSDREKMITKILACSQNFMRKQNDECSFVSLRDIERVMKVMAWFYHHRSDLFPLLNEKAKKKLGETVASSSESESESGEEENEATGGIRGHPNRNKTTNFKPLDPWTRSLVLAIGVCYHACLEKREAYCLYVARFFEGASALPKGPVTISEEIDNCQEVFLDNVDLKDNIARNLALKENLFMMIVCIELRIPLFLVGKPGSSKSLAKTVVDHALQGKKATKQLTRKLKEVHMISYQCSPLATADGIVETFQQCASLQKDKALNEFVSVVVLDEIGLAEDSPRMPLKALHPLLENGCHGDEIPQGYKKVGFIGISNWALDPAKMNRGILVQRGVPGVEELEDSARGICATNKAIQNLMVPFFRPLADAYRKLYTEKLEKSEFFGLRDFYSLVKMIYGFSAKTRDSPTWHQLEYAVRRNFGGQDDGRPLVIFREKVPIEQGIPRGEDDPDCSATSLIEGCLTGYRDLDIESRYLLILTENYAALSILQQKLGSLEDAVIIFGSSFPKDQEYTQVCRNINRVKVCMETGQTVVLLNLENLYESLYDALNQYYMELGGDKFVDLGLGNHRVKCKVHGKFRLIVVAEKQVVYDKFPIPLINRLEKHYLAMGTILTPQQMQASEELAKWAQGFADAKTMFQRQRQAIEPGHVFVGYHNDTAASVVLQVCDMLETRDGTVATVEEGAGDGNHYWIQVLHEAKLLLLKCVTPEAVLRLELTQLKHEAEEISKMYHQLKQDDIHMYLKDILINDKPTKDVFVQVTTHTRLLSTSDVSELGKMLQMQMKCLNLQEFDTQQIFCKRLKEFMCQGCDRDRLLIVQCDSGNYHGNLIACAMNNITDEYKQAAEERERYAGMGRIHVVFIVHLQKMFTSGFMGFQGGRWRSVHIEELQPQEGAVPLSALKDKSVSTIFQLAIHSKEMPLLTNAMGGLSLGARNAISDMTQHREEPTLDDISEIDMDDDVLSDASQKDATSDIDSDEETTTTEIQEHKHLSGRVVEVPPCGMEANFNNQLEMNETLDITQSQDVETSTDEVLDVEVLMRSCVQRAAVMLKDKSDKVNRTTERIQILLKLFEKKKKKEAAKYEGKLTVLSVMTQRVSELLKDKEKNTSQPERAKKWLSLEAASIEAINKAGTLKKSWWSCLQSKVTPLLAYVISNADINDNLNHVVHHEHSEWIYQLWLEILNGSNIIPMKYFDLLPGNRQRELDVINVQTKGHDGHSFTGNLPFSWLIKDLIDALLFNTKILEDQDPETRVSDLFYEQPLGQTLRRVAGDSYWEELVELYLRDFVQMVYKPANMENTEEILLVVNTLRKICQKNRDEREAQTMTLASIHLAFNGIRVRLHNFSQAVQMEPEVSLWVTDWLKNQKDHVLNKIAGMVIDILALQALLEKLTPDKDKIMKSDYRQKWVKTIERYQPVIDRILDCSSGLDPEASEYDTIKQTLGECSCLWTRVCAMRLFIEHVCPPGVEEEQLSVKRIMPLFKMLKETADFRKKESFTVLQKFLDSCNSQSSAKFFGNKSAKCLSCEQPMQNPVQLPCGHIRCQLCLQGLKRSGDRECPECREKYAENFKLEPMFEKREAVRAHNEYKQRCHTFFMELVSRLCFHGDELPEDGVINLLMDCVTCKSRLPIETNRLQSKPLTPFDDCIDPTPVVRSFLLQLLLRSNAEQVEGYLVAYFHTAKQLLGEDSKQNAELQLLIVHCLEDSYHNKIPSHQNFEMGVVQAAIGHLRHARTLFTNAQRQQDNKTEVSKLKAIAMTRFGLTVTAEWIYKHYLKNERVIDTHLVKRLVEAAAYICDSREFTMPRLFLLKQMTRRYGMDSVKQVAQIPSFRWILPKEAREEQMDQEPDRLIVCGGDSYKRIRETLAEIILGKDLEDMDEMMQGLGINPERKSINTLLALYTEVTKKYAAREEGRRVSQKMIEALVAVCQEKDYVKPKDLATALIGNRFGKSCRELTMTPQQGAHERMLIDLAVHFNVIMSHVQENNLLRPFLQLMNNPAAMQGTYLPTMPQDELAEAREALLAGRAMAGGRRHRDENPFMWECPNGHPYVIGDCGRPAATARCFDCGQPIGGTGHQAQPGNKKAREGDQTKTGHILGNADRLPRQTVQVRTLSPAATSVMRIILHLSMFHGANTSTQDIQHLIEPDLQLGQVSGFLWNHIQADLQILSHVIHKSEEDIAIFLHLLFDQILTIRGNTGIDCTLRTKNSRGKWEESFAKTYITPVLEGLTGKLMKGNAEIVNDNRLGNNPLMRLLYEVDQENEAPAEVENLAAMWRYRSRITVRHLAQELQENMTATRKRQRQNFELLQKFLLKEGGLRALRHLPGIIQLQKSLVQKFNRKIDQSEANSYKMQRFIDEQLHDHQKDELQHLVQNFADAWECVRSDLTDYTFGGGQRVNRDFCEMKVDTNTNLAMFLPSPSGPGICSLALVFYLVDIQNRMLNEYFNMKDEMTRLPEVEVMEVTQSQLVYFHPEKDLLPMILANCNYSLEVGKGTVIEYNFEGLEKQIEERFVKGKPTLSLRVSCVTFRKDFTNANLFEKLGAKVPQEAISMNQQRKIQLEMNHLPDLCDAIAIVEIAIGFLVSVGGPSDMLLERFMGRNLSMDTQSLAPQIKENCTLKHVRSLWLMLTHQRAQMWAAGGQDPFYSEEDEFKVQVGRGALEKLHKVLQEINVEQMLSQLYECIIFCITVKKDKTAEDYVDQSKLKLSDVLYAYADTQDSATDDVLQIPGDICGENCIPVWHELLKMSRKQKRQY